MSPVGGEILGKGQTQTEFCYFQVTGVALDAAWSVQLNVCFLLFVTFSMRR